MVGLPVNDAAFATDLGAYSVHLSLEFIDRRFVVDAHRRGLKVFVFTVNHPDDIHRMERLVSWTGSLPTTRKGFCPVRRVKGSSAGRELV
jgi:hypothetical protein